MAHRSNVIPVKAALPASPEEGTRVKDPVCGRTIDRKESRNMVFRGEQVIYFCSRECENNFLSPEKKKAS